MRATGDKPPLPPRGPVPQWIMMGPMHDMMQSVQEVAEEARHSNDLLREIKDVMGDVLRETQHAADARAGVRTQ